MKFSSIENALYKMYELSSLSPTKATDYQKVREICSTVPRDKINDVISMMKFHIVNIERFCDIKQLHFMRFRYLKEDKLGYMYDLIKLGEQIYPAHPCLGMQIAISWRDDITVDIDIAKYINKTDRWAREIIRLKKMILDDIYIEFTDPSTYLYKEIWKYLTKNDYVK